MEVIDYSLKPRSPSVQKALLHVLAAVLQNVEARAALLAVDAASGKVHKPEIVPMLVNLLATQTPEIADAALAQTPTPGTILWAHAELPRASDLSEGMWRMAKLPGALRWSQIQSIPSWSLQHCCN